MIFTRPINVVVGVIGAIFVACLALTVPVGAIDAESITLSPVAKPYTIDTSSVTQDSIAIINDGNTEYMFKVYAAPYSVSNYSYDADFATLKDNTDAFQWVQFDQTEWTLKPGERVDVPYTITVPEDATPGGHYGILFAETQPNDSSGSTQILRKKRVGAVLRATVNGNYITAGKTINSSIDWLQSGAPLQAKAQVENTGNIDFFATTTFRAQDLFGNIRHESSVENIIYPKTVRDINMSWDGASWGIYKARIETKVFDKVDSAESYVLVAPAWLLLTILVAVISIIYGAIVARKRHYKR